MAAEKVYKRILLKAERRGAERATRPLASTLRCWTKWPLEIGQLVGIGVQVGLVVGGGNLFRGAIAPSGRP